MAVCRGVCRSWPNKGAFFAKILNCFKLLIFLQKKIHRRCSTWLEIGFWLRVWNIELTVVPSLQIKPKKYWARKYVWRCFWKGQRSFSDSKQKECLCRSSRPKSSLKRMLWEILQNSQEKICAGMSFLVFSNEFCETSPFLQNSTGRLCLNITVAIVAKGVLYW